MTAATIRPMKIHFQQPDSLDLSSWGAGVFVSGVMGRSPDQAEFPLAA